MNAPDVTVDLQGILYDHAHYTADLPYDKTASITLGVSSRDKSVGRACFHLRMDSL
jgi:hypothetical protein